MHGKTCQRKLVACLNSECRERVELRELMRHVHSECKHTFLRCRYRELGCEKVKKRGSMRVHEEEDHDTHLQLALEHILHMKQSLSHLKEQIPTLKSDPRQAKPHTFKLHFHKNKRLFFKSPRFYSAPGGYHLCVAVLSSGTGGGTDGNECGLAIVLFVLRGENDHRLAWPLKGKITVTLLNQLKDHTHHKVQVDVVLKRPHEEEEEEEIRGVAISEFASDFVLGVVDLERCVQYLMDDTLYLSFLLETGYQAFKPWLTCTL